jgi:hypothetical protein
VRTCVSADNRSRQDSDQLLTGEQRFYNPCYQLLTEERRFYNPCYQLLTEEHASTIPAILGTLSRYHNLATVDTAARSVLNSGICPCCGNVYASVVTSTALLHTFVSTSVVTACLTTSKRHTPRVAAAR